MFSYSPTWWHSLRVDQACKEVRRLVQFFSFFFFFSFFSPIYASVLVSGSSTASKDCALTWEGTYVDLCPGQGSSKGRQPERSQRTDQTSGGGSCTKTARLQHSLTYPLTNYVRNMGCGTLHVSFPKAGLHEIEMEGGDGCLMSKNTSNSESQKSQG